MYSDLLPELSGKLPLRTCRGIIGHVQLATNTREWYPDHGPSILSDAWLTVQGSPEPVHGLYIGMKVEKLFSRGQGGRILESPSVGAYAKGIRRLL
ncbi:hypothetical protein MLD38_014459 [Melastoma candidum]|uniref:Uncharacterized protein n=1 Tax=Melastoma candidum TaxID=119954 RepID=A0ACB9RLB0_9MYRT|nr:hypothetical protein MLD38_014459 [Melastoma candidum]